MLQDGVGVYIPNSEDAVCGAKKIPIEITTASSEDDQKEAIKLAEEELMIPSAEMKANFLQEPGSSLKIRPPIIKPLSSAAVQVSQKNLLIISQQPKK